ncbi:MAG: 50S ribosomal protein L32 [Candidatus Omnitrophota bacterium]
MALPKKRHSKSRRDKSRTHMNLASPAMTNCKQCGKPILTHRVCSFCGYYKGTKVLEIKEKKPKK